MSRTWICKTLFQSPRLDQVLSVLPLVENKPATLPILMPTRVNSSIHVWSSQTHVCTLPHALESQLHTFYYDQGGSNQKKIMNMGEQKRPLPSADSVSIQNARSTSDCTNQNCSSPRHHIRTVSSRSRHSPQDLGALQRSHRDLRNVHSVPGTNQSRTNPHCWHSHYHCLVVSLLRVLGRCGHLQNPAMSPTSSFVQAKT